MENPKRIRMNKAIGYTAFVLLFSGLLLTGCSKEKQGCTDPLALNYNPDAEEDNGSCVLAGKGGVTTVIASPQHHGVPIRSTPQYRDSIFIKYNSLEFPGEDPSLYDLVVKGDSNVSHVRVDGLSQGNYYIFMTGYDTSGASVGAPVGRVKGGIPYTLLQEKGQIQLVVPVTE
jgi:hypothetical protein